MKRFLFDTAVFIYAKGVAHAYREPCRAILEAVERGDVAGEASIELVQEFVHVRIRRGFSRSQCASDARGVLAACEAHALEVEDVRSALTLLEEHPALDSRDATHAATALRRGIPYIISPDRAFDDVPGLERLDPSVALDVLVE